MNPPELSAAEAAKVIADYNHHEGIRVAIMFGAMIILVIAASISIWRESKSS